MSLNRLQQAILNGDVAAVRTIASSEPTLLETRTGVGTSILDLALQKGKSRSVAALLRAGIPCPTSLDVGAVLCGVISELSHELARAGWLDGIEFVLWQLLRHPEALSSDADPFAFRSIDSATLEDLRFLEERSGGWCHYADDGPAVVSRNEWVLLFEVWSGEQGH